MKISDIIQHLETIAPLAFQESYDNAGIITGEISAKCTGAIVCLDATEEVIEEAIEETIPRYHNWRDVFFYYRFQNGHPAINARNLGIEEIYFGIKQGNL